MPVTYTLRQPNVVPTAPSSPAVPSLFTRLPEDILHHVTQFQRERDAISLTQVNRYLYRVSQQDTFWHSLSLRKFGKLIRVDGSYRTAFLRSRRQKIVCAEECEHQAPYGRIAIAEFPGTPDLKMLTVLYANNFKISATFACVPAGIYRIVWQLYLTAETAGLRDLILRSTMYQRKDTTHRCQYDYRPTENHLLRLPKGQVVDLAMPQPIMVLPEHEYASVMAEVLSAGFNWKSNVSFVTVRFETIEATL